MTNKNIFLIVLIIFLVHGCRSKKSNTDSDTSAIPVVTGSVLKTDSGTEISISGNIEGYKTVRLGFMVAGKIDFIAANEGEVISKGEIISSLDPTSYAIAKELADIQVNQVQDEYDRLKLMHDNKSLSESDFAKISYGLQQAKAQQKLHTERRQGRATCRIRGLAGKSRPRATGKQRQGRRARPGAQERRSRRPASGAGPAARAPGELHR